jgi:hypothetical protein
MATRKPRETPTPVVVDAADDMLMQNFIQHCIVRHKRLRFRSKGEHAADHRLHQSFLDHTHTDMIPEQEEEQEQDA